MYSVRHLLILSVVLNLKIHCLPAAENLRASLSYLNKTYIMRLRTHTVAAETVGFICSLERDRRAKEKEIEREKQSERVIVIIRDVS